MYYTLKSGRVIKISPEDFDRLTKAPQTVVRTSGVKADLIAQRPIAHWLLGAPKYCRCTHINGDENDFTRENLTLSAKANYLDEFWGRTLVNNRMVEIGPCKTIPELKKAYLTAVERHEQPDIILNFPEQKEVLSFAEMTALNPGLHPRTLAFALSQQGYHNYGQGGVAENRVTLWAKPEVKFPREWWNGNLDAVERALRDPRPPWESEDIICVPHLARRLQRSPAQVSRVLRAKGWVSIGSPMVEGDRKRIWTKDWDRSLLGDPAEALRQRVKDFENKTQQK